MQPEKSKPRARWTLLVLLWAWAACMFLVVDLFWNVEEFEAVRPRASLYRGMRIAAHKIVGEPYAEDGLPDPHSARPVMQLESAPPALVGLSRTERRRIFVELKTLATEGTDVQVRFDAVRHLAEFFGPSAQAPLVDVAEDNTQPAAVRAEAARSIAVTGSCAFEILERILDGSSPPRVKEGAVQGLAELGTRNALVRVLSIAEGSSHRLRLTAVRVIERFDHEDAVATLAELAKGDLRRTDVRVAACRALAVAAPPAARGALVEVAVDQESPQPVRIAALEALEKAQSRDAVDVIDALGPVCKDASAVVAARAHTAKARLQARLEAAASRANGG